MSNQDLIVVKQLPIIQEQLKQLSTEIEQKVENAKSLVCTEETVKEVKQVRADLNKEFKVTRNSENTSTLCQVPSLLRSHLQSFPCICGPQLNGY